MLQRILTGVLSAALVITSANFAPEQTEAAKKVKSMTITTSYKGETLEVNKKDTISGTMDADGNLQVNVVSDTKADEVTIPDTVADMDGKEHNVTSLGTGAVSAASNVTVGQYVAKVSKGAISMTKGAKMTMTFQGPIKKGMFAKGAFQINLKKSGLEASGKAKAGKGLTIYVQTKRDRKQMKKQLKKAGVPGAKVRLYRLK